LAALLGGLSWVETGVRMVENEIWWSVTELMSGGLDCIYAVAVSWLHLFTSFNTIDK
jgi:hypothetical protein